MLFRKLRILFKVVAEIKTNFAWEKWWTSDSFCSAIFPERNCGQSGGWDPWAFIHLGFQNGHPPFPPYHLGFSPCWPQSQRISHRNIPRLHFGWPLESQYKPYELHSKTKSQCLILATFSMPGLTPKLSNVKSLKILHSTQEFPNLFPSLSRSAY